MSLWDLYIPLPLALAVVATIGYLFGRRNRKTPDDVILRSHRELRRAQHVAAELDKIAWNVRKSLANHQMSLGKFREEMKKLESDGQQTAFKELCHEAEAVLKPTLALAAEIAKAYDEIRQQGAQLMSFTEVRTDALTGLTNRRGLEDTLTAQFALMSRYETVFSLAIFDIDHFKQINDREGHLRGDQILQEVARVLDETARETDVVARYGGEEFVVVMPQTNFAGAQIFAERLRAVVAGKIPLTISGGVTCVLDGDTSETMLARADQALYESKKQGRNRVYAHDGEQLELLTQPADASLAE